jgi:hypothetical protein
MDEITQDFPWITRRLSQLVPMASGSWGPKADLSKIDEGILDAVGMG